MAPPELANTGWLDDLRAAQLQTVGRFDVYNDFRFVDRIADSGITFQHRIVSDAGRTYKAVHYDHGNGLAVADVDGDGLPDLYFTTQVGTNGLWRNLGGGRFEDWTERAGVGAADRIGVSASFADIDNDGDPDLYVTTVRGGNLLFENDGGGRFRDISAASGLNYVGHSSSAVFFDYDRDGLLDLFLVNVGQYTTDEVGGDGYRYYVGIARDAFFSHRHPELAEQSILFRNQGGNRFVDVSAEVGLQDTAVVRRREPDRRQRRRLDRPLRAEHAGGRRVLREHRRQTLRRQGSRGLPQDVVGRDGDQGLRLQQRRAPRHSRHRHALRYERTHRSWPGEAQGDDALGCVDGW